MTGAGSARPSINQLKIKPLYEVHKMSQYAEIPGHFNELRLAAASVASNAANTVYQPVGRIYNNGDNDATLLGVYWTPSASQNADTTNYRNLQIVNLGSDGTGTTVMASKALSATHAANVPVALTLVSGVDAADGDILAYVTTSTASGKAVNAALVQIVYQ
jgi:hypothetical protein